MAGIVLVAGMALSAYGAYEQSRGQKAAGKAAEEESRREAEILRHNAEIKQKEAEAVREAARIEAERFGEEAERKRAKQRVAFARAGVLATEGTPAMVLEEDLMAMEEDRFAILTEGALKAQFKISEAKGLSMEAAAALQRGRHRRAEYEAMAKGTLLTGAGRALTSASAMT